MKKYPVLKDGELSLGSGETAITVAMKRGEELFHNEEMFGGIIGRRVSFWLRPPNIRKAQEAGVLGNATEA